MLQISKIEMRLYSVLNPILEGRKSGLTPIYPRTLQDLKNRESVVVMNYLGDSIEGRAVSQDMLQPEFSFTGYSGEFIMARRIQEIIISALQLETSIKDYSDKEIRFSSYTKMRRSPVAFDNKSEMYIASVDYKFFVQSCI